MKTNFDFKYVDKLKGVIHGGSLRVTIPAKIVDLMELKEGDEIAFFKDENFKVALIMKARRGKVVTDFAELDLAFSVSKETAEKLARLK